MGIISSKLLKSDSKPVKVSTAIQTETPKETTEIPDVRSPAMNIVRTPITVEKVNCNGDGPENLQAMPLKNKLLKSLKLDPRSPTIGIYRTPILIEDTPSSKTSQGNCDSPISIYSCNVNHSAVEDLMTPIESSMNVSGFEVPQTLYYSGVDISLGCEDISENNENKSCIKVSDKPNTYEARKLLEEIISDEENFLKKIKMHSKPTRRIVGNNDKSTNEVKTKIRPPLSNITSSTNSPGNISAPGKLHSRNKIIPEVGAENSVTPSAKHRAQWDQNNTIVI